MFTPDVIVFRMAFTRSVVVNLPVVQTNTISLEMCRQLDKNLSVCQSLAYKMEL